MLAEEPGTVLFAEGAVGCTARNVARARANLIARGDLSAVNHRRGAFGSERISNYEIQSHNCYKRYYLAIYDQSSRHLYGSASWRVGGTQRAAATAMSLRPLFSGRYVRFVALGALTATLSACSGSPLGPTPRCAYDHTGDLVLVNLADTGTARDVYVDGPIVATVPYGTQIVIRVDAGVLHTVEWVSTFTGGTRDVTRVVVDECTATTLTNHF